MQPNIFFVMFVQCFVLPGLMGKAVVGNFSDSVLPISGHSSLYRRSYQDFIPVFSLQVIENGTWVHACLATLLSENYLLTAAQCLFVSKCESIEDEYCAQFPVDELRLVIVASEVSIQDSYKIKSYEINPSFYSTESAEGAISVLRLQDELDLSGLNIKAVRLGTATDRSINQGKATLIRWGGLENQSGLSLRKHEVALVSQDVCHQQYDKEGAFAFLADGFYGCWRSPHALAAALGDTGSSIYYQGRLIGLWFISKDKDTPSTRRKTHIYVSIPQYMHWILKVTPLVFN